MSVISSIFGAFNSMSVQFSTDTQYLVHTWNYTDLDSSKQPACPQRYLACSGSLNGDMGFVALGKLTSIEWVIVDTLLLKPATEGDALKENNGRIISYIVAYITAIRSMRAPTAQSHVKDIKFVPGLYYWPEDSAGVPYVGVQITCTVQEVLST
jgi:hypothetical protein